MGVKADVQWCPTADDIFLTWGSDIQLYQTRKTSPTEKLPPLGFRISKSSCASLICTSTEYTYIKCVSWCNSGAANGARLLAVGQANGRVCVTSINNLMGDTSLHHTREYVPRHGRCVNSLCWSEGPDSHLLLAALDRSGRDPSLLLYDVTRLPLMPQQQQQKTTSVTQSTYWQRASAEFCSNEVVHSAVFSRQTPSALIAATSHKYLKVIDVRDGKLATSMNTKAVYGLCCDPHSSHRLASYTDNTVHVWDLRQSAIPVVTLPTPRPIIKMLWSPTRCGFLGVLSRECSSVRLYDLQYAGRDLLEASVSVRSAASDNNTPSYYTSAFSWHATRYNTLLTASATGVLSEHKLKERITLNWSCRGDLIYTGEDLDDHEYDLLCNSNNNSAAAAGSTLQAPSSSAAAVAGGSSAATDATVSSLQQAMLSTSIGKSSSQQTAASSSLATTTIGSSTSIPTNSEGGSVALAVVPPISPPLVPGSKRGPPNPGRLYRLCAENWGEMGSLGTADGGEESLMEVILGDDISRVMCKRAIAGYGMQSKEDVHRNADALQQLTGPSAAGCEQLYSVWQWLGRARAITTSDGYRLKSSGLSYNYHGLLPIVSQAGHRSDIYNKCWSGLENTKHSTKVFKSEERTVCLQLVGWFSLKSSGGGQIYSLDAAVDQAAELGQYCRAAALSVFQLNLHRAIELLQAAAAAGDSALNAVAMALAGYNGERKALWRETCSSLRDSLSDPHLRAVFAFLTGDTDSYDPLLMGSDLSVCDRLGFALTFLSDTRLTEYLQQLLQDLQQLPHLDLQALIIAGIGEAGVELVQSYVDHTSDVQTAALLAIHGFRQAATAPPGSYTDAKLSLWVQSYEQLLCNQQLWAQRAQLVVMSPPTPPSPPQHVLLACSYCMKSIAASPLSLPPHHSPPKNQLGRMPQHSHHQHNKSKVMSCPHCRKPLPRCALCLQHLGTPSLSPDMHQKLHSHKAEKHSIDESSRAPHHLFIPGHTQARLRDGLPGLNPFSNWFTWCQTCRHGGHASHILQWFCEHSECPVTGCKCQCLLQDNISQQQLQKLVV